MRKEFMPDVVMMINRNQYQRMVLYIDKEFRYSDIARNDAEFHMCDTSKYQEYIFLQCSDPHQLALALWNDKVINKYLRCFDHFSFLDWKSMTSSDVVVFQPRSVISVSIKSSMLSRYIQIWYFTVDSGPKEFYILSENDSLEDYQWALEQFDPDLTYIVYPFSLFQPYFRDFTLCKKAHSPDNCGLNSALYVLTQNEGGMG